MNSNDKLAELVARWREPESPPLHTDQLNQAKRNGARLDCADELEAILHPPVEGELAEVYEDSTGARFIHQTRNEQLPPAGTKLYAAPAPSEPAEAVGELTVRRYRGSDAMVNYDFDLHATLPDGSYELCLRQTEPDHIPCVGEMVAARQPRQKRID